MHPATDLWLGSLYVLTLGVSFAAALWIRRRDGGRSNFILPPPTSSAEATALAALSAMRTLIHQIGNNAHELALQFDLALTTTDERKQKEVRDMLRTSLHRFIDISHQVAQLDSRLSGYSPTDPKRR
ncbi:MAG: hypothetical protein M3P27_08960 [Acidobacteriota bacterium]|nr:hypothetical protein [Acidobacteriota bacterium]